MYREKIHLYTVCIRMKYTTEIIFTHYEIIISMNIPLMSRRIVTYSDTSKVLFNLVDGAKDWQSYEDQHAFEIYEHGKEDGKNIDKSDNTLL